MANLLEQEADRLKRQYGTRYHEQIDKNLEWVSREMSAVPGSVDIGAEGVDCNEHGPAVGSLSSQAAQSAQGTNVQANAKKVTGRLPVHTPRTDPKEGSGCAGGVPNFVPTSKPYVLPAIARIFAASARRIASYSNSLVARGNPCKYFIFVVMVTQNPPGFGPWGFDSPSRHQHLSS